MNKLKKLNLIYLLLPLLIGLTVLSIIFRQKSNYQQIIILATLFAYISFSLTHHYKDKTLTLETLIEYILVAGLVLIIITGTFG